jgi:hypothetical protein
MVKLDMLNDQSIHINTTNDKDTLRIEGINSTP